MLTVLQHQLLTVLPGEIKKIAQSLHNVFANLHCYFNARNKFKRNAVNLEISCYRTTQHRLTQV